MEILDFCNQSFRGGINGSDECQSVTGATIVSPILMFLAGILGNIFALCVLYRTRTDVKATNFYTLVTALAWTDLLGIIMTSPSTIAAYVNGRQWTAGKAHCNYHGFVMTCFGLATPVIICAMAIERLLALKCVFFYSTKCKITTARVLVVSLWIGVLWYSVLPLFGIGHFELQYPGTWCFLAFHSSYLEDHLYGYIYASFNLITIMIMTFCNIYVMLTLVKARLLLRSNESKGERLLAEGKEASVCSPKAKQKQRDVEVQMIVLLCALTTIFALCWSPLMIQIIVTMATGKTRRILDLTAVRLASLNQTLDPWLYILLRKSFCVKVKKAITSILSIFSVKSTRCDQDGLELVDERHQNGVGIFSREHELTVCQDGSPDLANVLNSEIPNQSPVPSVAGRRQLKSDCLCQIHIDDSVTDVPGKRLFVKFVILANNRSSLRSKNRSSHRSVDSSFHRSANKTLSA